LLEKTFKFHPLTLEDVKHQNQRPKLEEYPGYTFVVLFTAELKAKRIQVREHHLYLAGQYLVSVHLEPSDPLNRLRDRIKANPDLTHRKLPFLFYLVVDQLVDSLFPVLDKLDDVTDEVEDRIPNRPDAATLAELSALKRKIVELRKFLGAQRERCRSITGMSTTTWCGSTRRWTPCATC
jgi:magnesium transporter